MVYDDYNDFLGSKFHLTLRILRILKDKPLVPPSFNASILHGQASKRQVLRSPLHWRVQRLRAALLHLLLSSK